MVYFRNSFKSFMGSEN